MVVPKVFGRISRISTVLPITTILDDTTGFPQNPESFLEGGRADYLRLRNQERTAAVGWSVLTPACAVIRDKGRKFLGPLVGGLAELCSHIRVVDPYGCDC